MELPADPIQSSPEPVQAKTQQMEDDGSPLEQMHQKLKSFKFPKDHYRQFLSPSCLPHQAQLLVGLNCGYEVLAHRVMAFDKDLGRVWERYTPSIHLYNNVADLDEAFADICESLITIPNNDNNSMLRMMLQGKLGEYLFSDGHQAIELMKVGRKATTLLFSL
jgi:hypothetical protein